VHVLGNFAPPLHTNLLVPYCDNGHLTEIQKTIQLHAFTESMRNQKGIWSAKGEVSMTSLLGCLYNECNS